jgi:hypothetical protein
MPFCFRLAHTIFTMHIQQVTEVIILPLEMLWQYARIFTFLPFTELA